MYEIVGSLAFFVSALIFFAGGCEKLPVGLQRSFETFMPWNNRKVYFVIGFILVFNSISLIVKS